MGMFFKSIIKDVTSAPLNLWMRMTVGGIVAAIILTGCSTNPATGESQFAALMSPQQENSVGAEENKNILRQFGGTVKDSNLQNYVTSIGQRLAQNTERPDVHYQFFVLDSPVVNAFSLPGGYVYVTRGVMALANTESQLAAVLAHEIGHVTARHAAERYSHGIVTSLGATVLGAAVGSGAATEVANLGSDLYITSYSRKQENQADELGIRYLHRAGYDPNAMAQFLASLEQSSQVEAQETGHANTGYSYFSTHPQTADRVAHATTLAAAYPPNAKTIGKETYLKAINGLMYGDSRDQGFARGTTFWHPQMGFTFTAPDGYLIANNPDEVIVRNASGNIVGLFDTAKNSKSEDPMTYLTHLWMKGEPLTGTDNIAIHGKPAAIAQFSGLINKQPVTVHLVVIQWTPTLVFRFQIATPPDADPATRESLKRFTGSLRSITPEEMQSIRPYHLSLVTAKAGDTVTSLANQSALKAFAEQRFRALNGMTPSENVTVGQMYKLVVE